MGCGCGGSSSKSQVAYQVKFKAGGTSTYATAGEAQAAIREKGGGTMRAVAVK